MNRKQSNKLDSYAAVEAALKSNPEVANVPGLPARLVTLSAKMDEIKSLVTTQTQPIQASTAKRNQRLDEMIGTTLEIAGFVTSIASEQNRTDLLRTVDVGAGFRRARRTHQLVLARRVLEAAQSVVSQLADYGVTPETLTSFEERIKTADEGLALPRSTIVVKRAATVKLAALFKEVDQLLKDHIDRLVFPLRTNVEFYAAYRAARSVVDRAGARRTAEETTATSATAAVSSSAVTEKAAA